MRISKIHVINGKQVDILVLFVSEKSIRRWLGYPLGGWRLKSVEIVENTLSFEKLKYVFLTDRWSVPLGLEQKIILNSFIFCIGSRELTF